MRVIEFLGTPRAGKTEQIKMLVEYLQKKGVEVLVVTDREIEKEIEIPLTEAFEYNLLFFNKILEKLLNAKHSKKYDLVILDRGFIDGEAWFNIENKQKNIKDLDKELGLSYLKRIQEYVDLGIFMIVEPSITIERHEKKGETGKADDYVLKTYLEGLYKEYLQLQDRLKDNQKILIINGREPRGDTHLKILGKIYDNLII